MAFSDEEVATAVDRFLLQQVSVPKLSTGARDVGTLRAGIYDLLSTTLLLRPDSYFYVVYLARNKLLSLISSQIAALEGIEEDGPNSTRAAKKVESTTSLASAQASLLELSAGLNSRTTGVRGSVGPAVDRFRKSVADFVSTELTKNVVAGGEVTKTGPEIRSAFSTTWTTASARHTEIVTLATNIAEALSALSSVKLPESSVKGIVSKVQTRLGEVRAQMESSAAIEQSRPAMLDLLAMRTLLTKASGFRNPELVLMPKTGDSASLVFLDSDGVEPVIDGTISGPFNYDGPATFTLSVNGGTAVGLILPEKDKGSKAELASKAFSPWVAPTPGDEVAFVVDFANTVSYSIPSGYASGAVAAVDLNAGLSPYVTVDWSGVTNKLTFRSADSGDASNLSLLVDTAQRQSFREWAFPAADVAFIENKGVPITAARIKAAISQVSPLVQTSENITHLASFTATRSSVGGEENILWDIRDSGNDLTVDAPETLFSPTKNFNGLGIEPGMLIHITAPSVATYTILAVNGGTLAIDGTPSGTLTYYIGPDYTTIPDGARVEVTGRADKNNTGFYRVDVGGGQAARIVVDRDLQSEDTVGVDVYTSFISIKALGTTTSAGIGVLASSAGATALGLAVTAAETAASLSRLQLSGAGDFVIRGIRSGDLVTLTSPTSVVYEVTVASVSATDLYVTGDIAYEAGNWTYEIRSARAQAFETLSEAATDFLGTTYVDNFSALDTLIGRLIRGAKFSSEISTAVSTYKSDLQDMKDALDAYTVTREVSIDNVVKTMREQGLDRALDVMLSLDVKELFGMEADGVSYATHLVRKAATVSREVVPVSKSPKSQNINQEWRPVSFQPNPWKPSEDS